MSKTEAVMKVSQLQVKLRNVNQNKTSSTVFKLHFAFKIAKIEEKG